VQSDGAIAGAGDGRAGEPLALDATAKNPALLAALRKDPGHASELALCSVLPSLATHARRTHGATGGAPSQAAADDEAKQIVHDNRRVARRDGAFSGTSFYFGMPAAMASIYCHQVLMVLQLATVYGHDPSDPARAAEIMVLRGRAPDMAIAAATLRQIGTTAAERGEPKTTLLDAARHSVRQLPATLKARLAAARKAGPFALVLSVLQLVCYVVPFLGIPVYAASYARATRLLGNKAREFYRAGAGGGGPGVGPGPVSWHVAPIAPRRYVVVMIAVTAVATLVTIFLAVHTSKAHHRHPRWALLTFASATVTVMYGRLLRILRPDRTRLSN
jgi:hypothetical protein